MSDLSLARTEEVDEGRQRDAILEMGDHLRDALWRVESAGLESRDSPGGLVVAGMGGSAIGGALAAAALGDRASRPIHTARSYGLPSWANAGTTVLCSSYSGNTEETVAAYGAAGELGAHRVVATTGGRLAEAARADGVPVIPLPAALQPRAAVAYMTVAALEVAAACGAAPRLPEEIEAAADLLTRLMEDWRPEGPDDALPKELARGLLGTVPTVVGAGLAAPVAYRWKTQLNENAKTPAFAHELPEVDHNEIVGWTGVDGLGRFSAVFLDDEGADPREQARIELTRDLIEGDAVSTFRVKSLGNSRTERVFSLVLLGDLVSLYLAVLRGIDPGPVEILDRLKDALSHKH